ncbi:MULTISPECIES: PLD nuclease N-terminal domain-containing protein [unclassified Microbacterium]|uniref:PLD nuclease N-terminal domain-containing protein n=1 Tax=unclassified Microbacterium TaxID=2609290 RepID=UPI00214B74E9|nr:MULTISPECIES: PLD nuclease N-terminal domain-containing protein [unclassified Microbacterium]MCR2784387.1 PLD nuclease N-terminal domain-containing protein [Microbacterium sp. zg.B96]MDL5350703.1 PLD nuclease N-terminal domain-containing protein [Microbacterium sp. zg-YB36]WIM14795.1 PLD nuclease N-terminal domain-containing protein [Microbacterium sp. zg-B96]
MRPEASKMIGMAKSKVELAVGAKIALGLLSVVQVAFAFLAFWDLAWRDKDDVRGPKPAWIPAILVNWIGPAAYFLFGIRHQR